MQLQPPRRGQTPEELLTELLLAWQSQKSAVCVILWLQRQYFCCSQRGQGFYLTNIQEEIKEPILLLKFPNISPLLLCKQNSQHRTAVI